MSPCDSKTDIILTIINLRGFCLKVTISSLNLLLLHVEQKVAFGLSYENNLSLSLKN